MNKVVFAFFAFLLLLPACQPAAPPVKGDPGIGDPYYPDLGNGGYDVQNYLIHLAVDPVKNEINGSTTIEAKATENLSAFDLDFSGLTIDSVVVNKSPAEYSRSGSELVITPSKPLRTARKFTVVIAYHGNPAGIPGVTSPGFLQALGWLHAENGVINVISEPNGASSWYPSNNHPRDKATYRFEITVPKPWVVAATGTLSQTLESGDQTTFIWLMDKPMASYLAAINIDKYTAHILPGPHGIVVRSYLPPGYPEAFVKNIDKLPEMITFLETVYGPYPFKEYGVVIADPENPLCADGGTADETQTLSVHCPSSSMSSEEVLVHELAHQWFGDSVSLENWKDIWLKEGMGTYAEWMWTTRDEGLELLTRVAKAQLHGYHPDTLTGTPSPDDLYRNEVYKGGALVFHALRLKVGDEVFLKILRTYLDRYKYASAGTDEFIAVAEEVSGQSLGSFFDSWLYTNKLPPLE